jgi:hypothetical protein
VKAAQHYIALTSISSHSERKLQDQ